MKLLNINKIKELESPPKVVKIFSDQEIKLMQELYYSLPERLFNKKQNIRKKGWVQNYNKELDLIYSKKIREAIGDYKMDSLRSENGDELLGLFHESFSPLPLHVDSGFSETNTIYKQVVTPLSHFGDTVIFKNKWYGKSTSFTINEDELKFKPNKEQNDRSDKHLGNEDFDKEIYQKYLTHVDINNLRGLKVELIYQWKLGETLIMDRTHIHCSSSRLKEKKLGVTTFTKK